MWTLILAVLVLWILTGFKSSRPDGTYLKKMPPYRRMMNFIMPTSNESVVYYDSYINATELIKYLKENKEKHSVDITHCAVRAFATAFVETPQVNRFVCGKRLYQRKGAFATFSMKRKYKDKAAKLAVVKLELPPQETFGGLCQRINSSIKVERSGKATYADKEFNLFLKIPTFFLDKLVRLFFWLNRSNLLPNAFMKNDAMFTSVVIANLGSLDMGAGYHHLYEWGTCPLFMMIGKIEDKAIVVDGKVVVQPTLHARYTYDERIDDGLTARSAIETIKRVLENPLTELADL